MSGPDEFDKSLAVLCAGFNVPCTEDRRAAYGKAFRKLPPTGWERLVDYTLSESGPDKMPRVSELWQLRKEMRASAPPKDPVQQGLPWEGDQWDIASNHHLLAHIVRRVIAREVIGVAQTHCLVEAKKAWAADMRDLARSNNGEVPVELQRSIWRDQHRACGEGRSGGSAVSFDTAKKA